MTELTLVEPAEPMTEREARDFIGYVRTQQDELPRRTVDAYQRRAWLSLGYGSWAAMCDGEGLRLPREVTAELRAGGLSLRAIGAVTGVSQETARADVAGVKPDKGNLTPAPVIGLDGKSYPTKQSEPGPDDPEDEPLWPEDEEAVPDDEAEPSAPKPYTRPVHRPERSEPVMLTLRTHAGQEVPYRQPASKATFNESTGDGISWAAWSWNPVTGCLHGCDYCYARAIAARFPDGFPVGFTPLFHHERLDAPANTTIPAAKLEDPAYRRVFVCSMADLYGRWVPEEWIAQVHASMLASPQWQYILLTKFPARYVGLELPPGAWVGTSVDEQKRVRMAEDAMRKLDVPRERRWLSLEPLREPLEFTDLSLFGWVVIGAQTETRQPDGVVGASAPDWPWWFRLAMQAHEAGCRVHIKPNLYNGRPGVMPDEYPEG